MEGWTFQGKRKHTPKLASPRQEASQPVFHTLPWDATPGRKRGLMHSEVHTFFFTSLGITALQNKEPFRARIWPVLVKDNDVLPSHGGETHLRVSQSQVAEN